MAAPHLSDETLAALVEERLDREELARVHVHVDLCPSCHELVVSMMGSYFADKAPVDPTVRSGTIADPVAKSAASGTAPELPWTPPGRVDEFKILSSLGSGAMGQVFLAQDTVLGRQVAIKFIAGIDPDARARERFIQEARAIARLTHPNVVAIHQVGEVSGRPFLVSEFIRGKSLDQLEKPLPWQRVLALGIDITRGLQAAHRNGVLHRDIKPANAILSEEGAVKLLDFGLAKLVDVVSGEGVPGASSHSELAPVSPAGPDPNASLRATAMAGTPLYLAPELWHRKLVTPQSDLYALGAVLFELCTGRAPVVAADLPDLERRMRADTKPVPPLASISKEINPQFASIIDRCLAWNPADRPRSAGELLSELSELSQQTSQRRTSRRSQVVMVAAAALGLVGAAVLIRPRVPRWTRPEMALIPGGSFQMGSTPAEIESALNWCNRQDPTPCAEGIFDREKPKHLVQVSSFLLDTTEVTYRDFVRWLNTLPNLEVRETSEAGKGQEVWAVAEGVRIANLYPTVQAPNPIDYSQRPLQVVSGFGNLPARMVTWDGALRYCREHGKRLPTEAEWEYAVRGPEGRRFPWGLEEPDCDQAALARVTGLPCSKRKSTSDEVATSPQDRTPQGIYDLGGNVSEWVMDVFSGPYAPCQGACIDPIAPEPTPAAGASRIVRGGSYRTVAAFARGASRSRRQHDDPFQDLGFRCARSNSR